MQRPLTFELSSNTSGIELARLRALLTAEKATPRHLVVGAREPTTSIFRRCVAIIAEASPNLVSLALGDFTFPAPCHKHEVPQDDTARDGGSWPTELGDLTAVLAALPNLEALTLQAEEFDFGPLHLPKLRSLAIRCDSSSPKHLAALADSSLPSLARLELWLGDFAYDWDGRAEDARPLLQGKAMPCLRDLTLVSDVADDLVVVLAESPILQGLETLDLSGSTLTDAGVGFIAANAPLFARLRRLDLSRNFVTESSRRLLQAELPHAFCEQQRPPVASGSMPKTKPRPTDLWAGSQLAASDSIWNRAATHGGGTHPGAGDKALAALLFAHGLAMNGGLRHASETMTAEELADALAGYRFFGLAALAAIFERRPASGYPASSESDITAAFERHVRAFPGDFAPPAP